VRDGNHHIARVSLNAGAVNQHDFWITGIPSFGIKAGACPGHGQYNLAAGSKFAGSGEIAVKGLDVSTGGNNNVKYSIPALSSNDTWGIGAYPETFAGIVPGVGGTAAGGRGGRIQRVRHAQQFIGPKGNEGSSLPLDLYRQILGARTPVDLVKTTFDRRAPANDEVHQAELIGAGLVYFGVKRGGGVFLILDAEPEGDGLTDDRRAFFFLIGEMV